MSGCENKHKHSYPGNCFTDTSPRVILPFSVKDNRGAQWPPLFKFTGHAKGAYAGSTPKSRMFRPKLSPTEKKETEPRNNCYHEITVDILFLPAC